MARLTSELVLSLNDRVSGPARGVEKSLDRLERQRRDFRSGAKLTARDVAEMGTARNMMLTGASRVLAPVAGAVGAGQVISAAADFESALTSIQKKAGTTAEQTAKLGEEIKALATSGELAVPIEEITAAYERGAAAGLPIDQLRQFAKLSATAADAFEMSAEDVGNAAAGFTTNLGIPIAEMERTFDLINGLADTGIADEKDIVSFLDDAGVSLKNFGLANGDIAALGATLLNLKMPADVAARAMDTLGTKLLTPKATKTSTAAFEKLYGSADTFTDLMKTDAKAAMLDFLKRIKELDKFSRAEVLTGILGQGFSGEVGTLADGIGELIRNLEYAGGQDWFGSLSKGYALKLDDMWSQWQVLKNNMAELAIDLGTMGMPAFKAGLQGAVDLVGQIQAGMRQMELEIDWSAVDQAGIAVGRLGQTLRDVLGINTSNSTLKAFFTDLSKVINDIARATKFVALELSDVAEFARDPIGFVRKERSPEELKDRWNITYNDPTTIARLRGEKSRRDEGAASDARERSLDDFVRADGTVSELSPPAERGGRFARPIPAFAPAMPAVIPAPTFGVPTVPLPTARPDVLGPVTQEGEAAALKAQELGQRITDAFSVTATPKVDGSSLDAFIAKARTAKAALDDLNSSSIGRAGATDYSGIHADIED